MRRLIMGLGVVTASLLVATPPANADVRDPPPSGPPGVVADEIPDPPPERDRG